MQNQEICLWPKILVLWTDQASKHGLFVSSPKATGWDYYFLRKVAPRGNFCFGVKFQFHIRKGFGVVIFYYLFQAVKVSQQIHETSKKRLWRIWWIMGKNRRVWSLFVSCLELQVKKVPLCLSQNLLTTLQMTGNPFRLNSEICMSWCIVPNSAGERYGKL